MELWSQAWPREAWGFFSAEFWMGPRHFQPRKKSPWGWWEAGGRCRRLSSLLGITHHSLPFPHRCEKIRGPPAQSLERCLLCLIPSPQLGTLPGDLLPPPLVVSRTWCWVESWSGSAVRRAARLSSVKCHPCPVLSVGDSSLSLAWWESRAIRDLRGQGQQAGGSPQAGQLAPGECGCLPRSRGLSYNWAREGRMSPREHLTAIAAWHSPNNVSRINICSIRFCLQFHSESFSNLIMCVNPVAVISALRLTFMNSPIWMALRAVSGSPWVTLHVN